MSFTMEQVDLGHAHLLSVQWNQGWHSCASVRHRPFIFFLWTPNFQLKLTIMRPLGRACIHIGVKISHEKSLTVSHFCPPNYQNIELKAYSLMLNRGRYQNFQNLFFFVYFCSSPLRSTIPQRNYSEIISV